MVRAMLIMTYGNVIIALTARRLPILCCLDVHKERERKGTKR
jgi:hypothetical protein